MIAFAQEHIVYAQSFLDKIKAVILYPLISLMLGVAVVVFLWGIFEMVMHAENSEARSTGRTHMLAGIIGIVVMLSALTLLRIAANTFGVEVPSGS